MTRGLLTLWRRRPESRRCPATNLLQPGNRATFRLLVADAGRPRRRRRLHRVGRRSEAEPGQRLENIRDLRPEVRRTLERAEQFLGLAALVAVILAAVAVALAASLLPAPPPRHGGDAALPRRWSGRRSRCSCCSSRPRRLRPAWPASCWRSPGRRCSCRCSAPMTARTCRARAAPALARSAPCCCSPGFAPPPLIALAARRPCACLQRALPRPRPAASPPTAGRRRDRALIAWQRAGREDRRIMIGGIAGLLAVAAWQPGADRAAEAAAPARRDLALRAPNLRRRGRCASSLQIGALALGMMALLLYLVPAT